MKLCSYRSKPNELATYAVLNKKESAKNKLTSQYFPISKYSSYPSKSAPPELPAKRQSNHIEKIPNKILFLGKTIPRNINNRLIMYGIISYLLLEDN